MNIESGWVNITDRRNTHCLNMLYKVLNNLSLTYLRTIMDDLIGTPHTYNLRNMTKSLPKVKTEKFRKSFFPYTIKLWNSLELKIKSSASYSIFKNHIKKG